MTKSLRPKLATITKTRWAAYAAAGTATALAGTNSAEAAIHYSGRLDVTFPAHKDRSKSFPLDQAGDFLSFERAEFGAPFFGDVDIAYFKIHNLAFSAASFRGGLYTSYRRAVSKLPIGENISGGAFFPQRGISTYGGLMAKGHPNPYKSLEWDDRGTGCVGFRFNNGEGVQYGWVRVKMSGLPENAFQVLDYAYADPGEAITAGQTTSDERASHRGSLGWLAAGAAGLFAWRRNRSLITRKTKRSPSF